MMIMFLAIAMVLAMLAATVVGLHEEAQQAKSRVRTTSSGRFGPRA